MLAAFLLITTLTAPQPARAESFGASFAQGQKADKRGELETAIAYYDDALRDWIKSDGKKARAQCFAARASAYERHGQTDRAISDWDDALRLEPKSGAYYRKRGELYLRLSNPSRAISDFYKAAALNLNDADAYFDRGVAYELQGDLQFAREDYRTACRLGFKKACHHAKEAKDKLLATRKGTSFEAVSAERSGPVEIKRVKSRRRYKLDFEACLSGLNACVQNGDSFGQCVQAAKLCESGDTPGCCPRSCVDAFDAVAEQQGEAEAFREDFVSGAKCAK